MVSQVDNNRKPRGCIMFFKNGVLTETPFRSVNHYASLPQYTEDDKKQIADLCAVCARSYSKCLGKTHKEDTWFGALDVFSYVSEAHRFSSEFPLIRKWSEDWKEARLNDNPDVDIDKSIKCQLGRIFCDALQTDPNAVYKWRRVEGKYFEYCRIK